MFIITLTIDDIDELYKIGAIRIKPKYTPKTGELCTYTLVKIENNKQIELNKKIQHTYGSNPFRLSQKILKAITN